MLCEDCGERCGDALSVTGYGYIWQDNVHELYEEENSFPKEYNGKVWFKYLGSEWLSDLKTAEGRKQENPCVAPKWSKH